MKYAKPEITLGISAFATIQSQVKGFHLLPDSALPWLLFRMTNGSYEADE